MVLPERPTGAMWELVALPRLREPETRPGRQTRLHRDANIEAVLAQSTGQMNDPECAHCAQGSGVWASCVSVPGSLLGSCAITIMRAVAVPCVSIVFGPFLYYL